MRILYITYDGLTDPLGQSQIIPYLKGLADKGAEITVLSCEKPLAYSRKKENIELILKSGNISWKPVIYTKKPAVISTLWDLWKLRSTAVDLHKQKHFQIVHCRSYIAALIGAHLKSRFKIQFLFDMRGFWPEERVEGGLWNLKSPVYLSVYNFFKRKEKQLINEAEGIVVLSEAARQEIAVKYGENLKTKITTIPCCVDTTLFDRERLTGEGLESTRRKINLTHKDLVIGYLGSIGTWYMLEEMLDFFARLVHKAPEAKLLFITEENKENILRTAHKKGIDTGSIRITAAERPQIPYYISLCDAGLFFIRPSYSKMASSPTKLGEFLSMNVPVISNKGIGDLDTLINIDQTGLLVNSFSEEALNAAVDQLPEVLKLNKGRIREYAIAHFDLKKGIAKYFQIYEDLYRLGPAKR